jgi:hypothetical protein
MLHHSFLCVKGGPSQSPLVQFLCRLSLPHSPHRLPLPRRAPPPEGAEARAERHLARGRATAQALGIRLVGLLAPLADASAATKDSPHGPGGERGGPT